MSVPSVSNPSNGTVAAGTDTLTISHTSESGKTIYFLIFASTFSGFSGETDFDTPTTFDGVSMNRKASFYSSGPSDIMRTWIFTLPNPSVATANLVFDGSALSTSGWNGISGIAFNVADGPVNGDVILPGGFYSFSNTTTFSKKAYAWDSGGLQITAAWGLTGAGITITEGTNIDSTTGLSVNKQNANGSQLTYTANRSLSGRLGIFSFLIPPSTQSVSGGSFQPWFTGSIDITAFGALSVGDWRTAGLPYGNGINNSPGFGRQADSLPMPGTIRSLVVRSRETPGSGNTIRCELIVNNYEGSTSGEGILYPSGTGVTVDLTDANWDTGATFDGVDLAFYRYQQLGLKFTFLSGSGTISSSIITASFLVEAGVTNEQIYGGGVLNTGSSAVDVPAKVGILHPWNSNWGTFPNTGKSLVGIDGDIKELLITYQRATSLADDTEYYLEVNGVLQDGTGGTIDTKATLVSNTANRSYARSTFTLPIAAGDFISVVGYVRDGASSILRSGAVIKYVPNVPGEFMLSGHSTYGGYFDHVAQFNSSKDDYSLTTTDESIYGLVIPPLTALGNPLKVTGLRENFDAPPTGPGSSRSWSSYVRKNFANTAINVVIADAQTTGTTSGDEDFDSADQLTIRFNATNFPDSARQFWTIPGLSLEPNLGIIIVQKDAGGNTSAVFGFTASGGLSPGSFNLSGGDQQVYSDVAIGSGYGFSETPPAGWQQESVTVSNGSPINNIAVAEGETVTVIFVNSLITPANNPSGMYEMIRGKTNDTIWIDVAMGVSEDRKIP